MKKKITLFTFIFSVFLGLSQGSYPVWDKDYAWGGDQNDYLTMIRGYCDAYGVDISDEDMRAEAIEWQATRGSRSGRVAWQYFTDLAARRCVVVSG